MRIHVQDLRYAVRSLRSSRGTALIAVLILALGIGVNTALFSVLNGLLFRPPPGLADTDGLVRIQHERPYFQLSAIHYQELREAVTGIVDLVAYHPRDVVLSRAGEPELVSAHFVSGNYFDALHLRPAAGRGILRQEDAAGDPARVVVLSHELWRTRFAADPGVVGEDVTIIGTRFTVVGVAPDGFAGVEFQEPADLWLPSGLLPGFASWMGAAFEDRLQGIFSLVGRLEPGISEPAAESALNTFAAEMFVGATPVSPHGSGPLQVTPLRSWIPREQAGGAPLIYLAFLLTGAVLLLTCTNVATLQLARAISRHREMGVRLALGARRGRIVRQFLVENALLALAGGALGVLLVGSVARWLQQPVRGWIAPIPVELDGRVLLFTAFTAAVAALLSGLVPALRGSRPDPLVLLQGENAGHGRAGRNRLLRGLVALQVAMAIVLLTTAGLALRTLGAQTRADLGFDADRIVALEYHLHWLGYDPEAIRSMDQSLLDRAFRTPGVEAVAIAGRVPVAGPSIRRSVFLEDPDAEPIRGTGSGVGPGYFRVIGTPLLRGRDFKISDDSDAPPVAIVNQILADRLWPTGDPLGRRVRLDGREEVEIVGIAPSIVTRGPGSPVEPHVYRPYAQAAQQIGGTVLLARGPRDAATLATQLRAIIREIDPDVPVAPASTVADHLARQHAPHWRLTGILAGFGALALVLASLGIYGVVGYAAARRTREIGIRIAVGAEAGDVVRLLLKEAIVLMALGATGGLLVSLAAIRIFRSLLQDVQGADPSTFALVVAGLACVALVAALGPARRAARVDPMISLRAE